VATRRNLKTVALIRAPKEDLFLEWLEACRKNRSLRHVSFCQQQSRRRLQRNPLKVSTVVGFLDKATQLNGISMLCNVDFDEGDDGPTILAAVLSRNSNIRLPVLHLNGLQEECCVAILKALRSNRSIKCLKIRLDNCAVATLSEFQALMRTTTSLRRLGIHDAEGDQRKGMYMELAKTNFSLRTAIGAKDPNLFNDKDRILLQS